MRLTDLQPQFLRYDTQNPDRHVEVDSIAQASGIMHLCPACFLEKGGPVGCHRMIEWKPEVPQTCSPTPGRWHLLGTGYDDLTLKGETSDSVLQQYSNGPGTELKTHAHFFIRNGEVLMC